MITVTVLGSGTGIPSLQRHAAGYHLAIEGRSLLVDCGSATLLRLEEIGHSSRDLDAAFITHHHGDHVSDLIPLIHALRHPGWGRKKPLCIFGAPGFPAVFQQMVMPITGNPDSFSLHLLEAEAEQNWEGVTVFSQATIHSERMQSVAYRFEWEGKRVVFTGDSDEDPALIPFMREADLVVSDCSTLDAGKIKGHLSAGGCGRLAAAAGVKRLLLSHFYPIAGPDSLRQEEASRYFSGEIQLAEDLLRIAL